MPTEPGSRSIVPTAITPASDSIECESERVAELARWFDGGAAYLDPNDHGPVGYSLISLLLLVYDRVVVHSPYAGKIVVAATAIPEEFAPALISWNDIRSLSCETDRDEHRPPLCVTAFPTYVDPAMNRHRDREWRAIRNVDDERLDSGSVFRKSVLLLERDVRPLNAAKSIRLASDVAAEEAGNLWVRDNTLPPRYRDAADNAAFFCPQPMAEWWPHASPGQKVFALAAYDHFNDRAAMEFGHGDVHCLTAMAEYAVDTLFGLAAPPFPIPAEAEPGMQTRLFMEVVEALVKEVKIPRMDAGFIRAFRRKYRREFLHDLARIVVRAGAEPDPYRRSRLLRDEASRAVRVDRFPLLVSVFVSKVLLPKSLGLSGTLLPSLDEYVSTSVPILDPSRRSRWRYALRTRPKTPWQGKAG